jgi:hypothetical protein
LVTLVDADLVEIYLRPALVEALQAIRGGEAARLVVPKGDEQEIRRVGEKEPPLGMVPEHPFVEQSVQVLSKVLID